MELLGITLDAIGKVMVSSTALMVHYRFWKEHKVDNFVFKAMRRERVIGVVGIIFILLGYIFELLANI